MITQVCPNKSKQVICIYRDEREAIRAAKAIAKQAGKNCGRIWEERVLQKNGDMRVITYYPQYDGFTEELDSVWESPERIHCQKSVADKL